MSALISHLLALALSMNPPIEPVRYRVTFPNPAGHLAEVEARFQTQGASSIEVMIPVWTPGSYIVREYARHIEGFDPRSRSGAALSWHKTRKNRWKIETPNTSEIALRYKIYCRELGVQTNWVDADFALLNGAATFITPVGGLGRPAIVELALPKSWSRAICALPESNEPNTFLARDYDELVDSPIYAGNPAVYPFEVDGKPHLLVNHAENGVWDGPKAARDVQRIVETQRDFWGSLPYEKYVFFNILCESGGGLEHKNSTVLMTSRFATRTTNAYFGWLCLVSHEFFHTWNVKRLRPAELGPFDYENEVYTKCLWIAEGLTSYYDRLLVRRAGLCSVDDYLAGDPPSGSDPAKNEIQTLQNTLGRLVQPLESASFDAWIKFYRRDESTPNTAISYYLKGAVVGWLLDVKIREATNNTKSLDTLMRTAYTRFSGDRGYSAPEFRALASEIAGVDLEPFLKHALETTRELEYEPALKWFGLRWKPPEDSDKSHPPKSWLGAETKSDSGRLLVSHVRREGPAFAAGLNVNDEIIAFNGERVRADNLDRRLEQFHPGETVKLLVSRQDHLVELKLDLEPEPSLQYILEIDPGATPDQIAHRKSWLGE